MRYDALMHSEVRPDSRTNSEPEWVQLVRNAVRHLDFGVVQIVVHNAKVVQIEKTEKVRLDPAR